MAFNHPIHSLCKGIRGFVLVSRQGLRYRDMITKIALHKAKILTFWDKHGLVATLDAFKIKRKRSWSPEVIEEIKRLHLTHYHTYPRTPKMNAHCERFNRTVQDEFVDYHLDEMIEPDVFNQKLNLIEKVV